MNVDEFVGGALVRVKMIIVREGENSEVLVGIYYIDDVVVIWFGNIL
ncbi:hypothetical protein [Terrimonas sp.]|nr:hypothetical protein [Terrimonas sp.]